MFNGLFNGKYASYKAGKTNHPFTTQVTKQERPIIPLQLI